MDHEYTSRKQEEKPEQKAAEEEESSYGPSMAALASGAADPTPEQRGRSVDLPGAIRAKMENAFGADLSNLRLYESRAVADAGADAMSRGAEIAFAPGLIDFTGYQGQALLGHEVSHLVSQARGEVTGAGFLNDPALEARAEAEGAMAAAGEQVRMPTAALSPVTVAGTTGPIQAAHKQKDEEEKAPGGAPPAPAEASAPVAGPTAAPLSSVPQSRFLYSREYDETRGTLPEKDQQLYDQMMDEFLVHGLKHFSPLPTKERTKKNGYFPPTEDMFLNSGYDVTAGNGAGTKAYEKAFRQFRSDKKNWYSPTMQHHNEMVDKISAEQSRQYHQIFNPDPAPAQQDQAPAQQAQGGGDMGMMGPMMQDPQQNMIQQQQMTIQMLQAENTRLQSKIKEMESMMQAYKDKLGITQADDLTAQD